MKHRLFLMVVLIVSMTLSGCFFKSSRSSNPVGPQEPNVDISSNIEEVATGTASISFRFIIPEGWGPAANVRASTVSATISTPYAKATLYVDGVIAQVKSEPVVNGAVSFTFTGVQDSGTAKLELELFGCSYLGATNFTGTAPITQNTVIALSPYYPPGSNRTSDGKLLVEVASNEDRGRITFNDLGQPIGFSTDRGSIVNYVTGETLITVDELHASNPNVALKDLAWFEGALWIGGNNVLTKVDLSTKAVTLYGDPDNPANTVDGSTLDNVKFAALRDMQVYGDTLYFSSGNFTQMLTLKNGVFSSTSIPVIQDGVFVLDTGKTFFLTTWNSNPADVFRLEGGTIVESVTLPEDKYATSMVAYNSGYLIASQYEIYYWDGTKNTVWMDNTTLGKVAEDPATGHYYIYKNAQGVIYVCSEYANKIWRVQ